MLLSPRSAALWLAAGLLLGLPARGQAARSLRADQNKLQTDADNAVANAMQSGFMLMSKLMAKEQEETDGPAPCKESMQLSDQANNLFYASFNKLNLARTAADAASELLQTGDKTGWTNAASNLADAKTLLQQGSSSLSEGRQKLNQAHDKSPDVDPMAKVWSETATMGNRASALERNVQGALSRATRRAPKEFNLLQMKTSDGFKKVAEKAVKVEDKEEDSLVAYIENLPKGF